MLSQRLVPGTVDTNVFKEAGLSCLLPLIFVRKCCPAEHL